MKFPIILMLFSWVLAAGAQASFINLDSVKGGMFSQLLDENRVIAIGELHGTTEVPLLVLELAKAMREDHDSITVALEISQNFQPVIDAFLIDGQTEKLKTIEHFKGQDGRSSVAMVHLISGLRNLKGVKIACFDVDWGSARSATRDSLMGANLTSADGGKAMLILTGNLHATVDAQWMRPGFKSAILHYKEMSKAHGGLLALDVYSGGGTAWNCQREGCDVFRVGRYPKGEDRGMANFIRYDQNKVENGFNGIVYFNEVRASLPFHQDTGKLDDIIEAFQEAIIAKDSVGFKKLFFRDDVPFTGIMSGLTELSIKKDYPDFQGIAVSNSTQFIDQICRTKKAQREQFFNTSIDSDGMIASVSFDYAYYSDDHMLQWGHEKWNVVRVDNQWLITDVTYSIHFPDVEACPFID